MSEWLQHIPVDEKRRDVRHGNFADHILTGYKRYLDEALLRGVGRKSRKKKRKSKLLVWSDEVYATVCEEKRTFWEWRHDKHNGEKRQAFRKAKRARKTAARNTNAR
jgi:hypothetical protein